MALSTANTFVDEGAVISSVALPFYCFRVTIASGCPLLERLAPISFKRGDLSGHYKAKWPTEVEIYNPVHFG